MTTETISKILLVVCVIALCVIALNKTDKKIVPIDPIARRIEAVNSAFPHEDSVSRVKRAELIERILSGK